MSDILSASPEHLADARAAIERCIKRIEKQARYYEDEVLKPERAKGLRMAASLIGLGFAGIPLALAMGRDRRPGRSPGISGLTW